MRIIIILSFIVPFLSCSGINVKRQVEIGFRQYRNDSLKEAINTFSIAIEVTDTCRQCFLYRGFAYKGLKEYSKALEDFNSLINLDPDDAVGYANKASVYYMQENYREALRDFTIAYKLHNSDDLLNPICHMLFINGYKDSACAYYHKLTAPGDTTFDSSIKEYCDA